MNPLSWKFRRRSPDAGSSLIPVLILTAVILSFLAIAGSVTSQFSRLASRQQGVADLVAATDGGLEYAYAAWKAAIIRKGLKPPLLSELTAIQPTAATNSNPGFARAGISFTQLSIDTVDQSGNHVNSSNGSLPGSPTANVPGYPGWTGYTYYYRVDATAQSSHFGNPNPVHVVRYLQLTQVPLFQAAIFYENDLELHPGAPMIVTGLVHSNKNLYAQGFNTLQFKNNVSYVTSYHESTNPAATSGWDGYGNGSIPASTQEVTWADNLTSSTSQAKAGQLHQVSPLDPFGGTSTNNNGLHDIIEVPPSGDNSSQKVYNNASLIITIDSSKPLNNPQRVTVSSGNGITLTSSDINYVKAALDNGATVYDQREASNVTITSLDMAKLNVATGAAVGSPPLPAPTANSLRAGNFNGVIYVQDIGTNGKKGIRLKNGRSMPMDTTIASNNGVYVQGDFNTGGTQASDIPANVSNPSGSASPVASGYQKSSCAILADAVTVLSNSWNDSNSGNTNLNSRLATPTTVNAAILAGDVQTNLNNNGVASGGAQNFPRLLENWNNVDFTYWGSLVEAFYSEKFTGLWQTNNVYHWPNRKWNFDNQFLNRPPPGTPQNVQYSRGRWERN